VAVIIAVAAVAVIIAVVAVIIVAVVIAAAGNQIPAATIVAVAPELIDHATIGHGAIARKAIDQRQSGCALVALIATQCYATSQKFSGR